MPFDSRDAVMDETLQHYSKMRQYLRDGRMPWRRERGAVRFIARTGAASAADHELDARAFSDFVRRRFQDEIDEDSRFSLWRTEPQSSARSLLSRRSAFHCLAAFALFGVITLVAPGIFLAALVVISSTVFLAAALTRCLLVLTPAHDGERPPTLPDAELPTVTILAPLFREAHSIPGLVDALNNLDYPGRKLDIKLLFEEVDLETRREAERLKLDERFDLIVIPAGSPQTKPKACNVGLASALGEFIVIYDAEDEPEPRQLRDAVEKFAAGGPDLACVQSRLNFYNHSENWLSRGIMAQTPARNPLALRANFYI